MLIGREVGWCRLGRSDTRESELEVTIEFMKICVLMSPLYCDLDFLQLRSSMIDRLWGSIQEDDDGREVCAYFNVKLWPRERRFYIWGCAILR
jgi:hypothetical protein